VTSTRLGLTGQLDAAALRKVQAGCSYINAEIAKARRKVFNTAIVAALLTVAVLSFVLAQVGVTDGRALYAPLVVAVLAAALVGVNARRSLSSGYKQIVIGRIVNALGHELTYSRWSRLTEQDFVDMDLFEQRVEDWHAEDEIGGRKGAVTYSITEAKATRTEGSGDNERTITIFTGLIVRLDFNKRFLGHTVVVPHGETKALGGIFGSLLGESGTRRRKEIVNLENVDFEKEFTAYSTDQQEARYILTPKLMELIMRAQSTLGSALRLCFRANSVFVTVPQISDRFEVSLFGPKVTPELVLGELGEVIALAEHLIDVLELETRIWSRV
jgi:hypothetical protein